MTTKRIAQRDFIALEEDLALIYATLNRRVLKSLRGLLSALSVRLNEGYAK